MRIRPLGMLVVLVTLASPLALRAAVDNPGAQQTTPPPPAAAEPDGERPGQRV
jgi:hypothetical protein